ncbi:hypothetical protein IFM61392_09412 [Aspergillus lentulus]|nr:hypothetical protein IFM61392_09412 [Aspergillus lentulus]
MHFELSNRSDGPLRVPGMSGIPLHHELPVGQRFAHAVADWRRDPRLTKPEMLMLHFMEYVTEQPGWKDSLESDVPIMEQWQRKAFSTFDLTPRAWEWCLAELKDKAWEFKRTDYVTIKDGGSPVAKSDRLVSYSLLQNLREELQPLLDDRTASFDESGKSSPLRHLVDPSLHPLVYERTNVLVDGGRHWLDPAGPHFKPAFENFLARRYLLRIPLIFSHRKLTMKTPMAIETMSEEKQKHRSSLTSFSGFLAKWNSQTDLGAQGLVLTSITFLGHRMEHTRRSKNSLLK